jgi:hypothetical protein
MNGPHHHSRRTSRRHELPPASSGVVVSCPCGIAIGQSALERLEELDDAIFAALDGDADALDRSRVLWSDATREVDAPLLAESQAQYARQARLVWDASRGNPEDSLARTFAALEVLGLVADE